MIEVIDLEESEDNKEASSPNFQESQSLAL